MEVSAVGAGEGFVDVFDQGVAGRFRDVKATLVIEGAVVEVPVLRGGAGQRDGGCFHSGECVNDELVGGGGFSDFRCEGGIKHIDVEVGEEDLFRVVGRSVHLVFSG